MSEISLTPELLLALAGLVSSIGAVIATYAGNRSSKRDVAERAAEDCRQLLRGTRAEAEALAAELHALKMGRP